MVGSVSGSEALGLEVGMRYEQKHAVTNECNRERTVKSKVVDHPVQQDLEADSLNEAMLYHLHAQLLSTGGHRSSLFRTRERQMLQQRKISRLPGLACICCALLPLP